MPLVVLAAAVLAAWILGQGENVAKIKRTATREDKQGFAQAILKVARAEEAAGGPRAVHGIVQSSHESYYGLSELALPLNFNIFGMTAEPGTWWRTQNRPYVELPTSEVLKGQDVKLTRPFRRYGSWEESYRDWSRLMKTSHYASALALSRAGNFKGFAQELRRLGYATQPDYDSRLASTRADLLAAGVVV